MIETLGAGLAVLAVLFVADRLLLKAEERGWIYWRRRKGSPGSVGSAALQVHQIIEPSKKYVLQIEEDQQPEAARGGDPPEPGKDR